MTDNLATLQAAEAAGATIQAFTVFPMFACFDSDAAIWNLTDDMGYWRDLEGPVQWTCHPSRYRVKPEDAA